MQLNIRRFFRLHKILTLYSLLIIVGIISLFVGLIPGAQRSIALVKELRATQDEISRIQKKAQMLSTLDQLELQKYGEALLAAVPSDKSVSTLLSTIEELATKHDLIISEMTIEGISTLATGSGKAVTRPEGNSITETLSLQGDLVQLRNFLFESTHVRRLMRINDMTLASLPKTNRITAKLIVEVFYLPLPVSIGKPSDPLEPFTPKELLTLEKISSFPIIYVSEGESASANSAQRSRGVPTEPSVIDPFAPPYRIVASPLRPTPSLMPVFSPTPTVRIASPSATPRSTPSLTPSPTL